MTYKTTTILAAALLLTACQAATETASAAETTKDAMVEKVAEAVELGADIKEAPSGLYVSDPTHSYINMTYSHQGFSNPTIRWGAVSAQVNLDAENVEASTLNVTIDANSIDTGVDKFDAHLRSPDFFDTANHPKITFVATDLDEVTQGRGKVTGDLTIKGKVVPLEFDVVLNRVGKHFQSGVDMFGISGNTQVTREELGVNAYAQVAPVVDLNIEVEFWKSAE